MAEGWFIKAYHQFMVLFPVLLIIFMIILVFTGYLCTYLLVLIQPYNNNAQYPFENTSTPETAFSKGVSLLCTVTLFCSLMMIALFRVILMDPGYFPNPLEMERQIVIAHSKIPRESLEASIQIMKDDANAQKLQKSNALVSRKEPIQKEKNNNQPKNTALSSNPNNIPYIQQENEVEFLLSRFEFMNSLNGKISNQPLHFTESINLRNQISHYLRDFVSENNTKTQENLTFSNNISNTETSFIINNNSINNKYMLDITDTKIWNNFLTADLAKAMLCGTCMRWKVERSHHCKQCGKCVLKMDHHCPWMANCIGFRNYKYFLLVHLYGILGCSIILCSYWEVIIANAIDANSTVLECWFSMLVYLANLGLLGFLMWLFLVNWRLVFNGETVIENADRERFPTTKAHNMYNLGCLKNFTSVFGENPLVWFIPFYANYKGGGIVYETSHIK